MFDCDWSSDVCSSDLDVIFGGDLLDTQAGSIGADAGNDSIVGGAGNDTVHGGAGNDVIFGRSEERRVGKVSACRGRSELAGEKPYFMYDRRRYVDSCT